MSRGKIYPSHQNNLICLNSPVDRWGYVPREKVVWRETALRRQPRALENTYHSLLSLALPVPSVPYTARGQQHQRTAALEMRHNRLPS